MAKANTINELSEILATALAGRPDLDKRLSSLMGSRVKPAQPGQGKVSMSVRKQVARTMFTRLNDKSQQC